MGAAPKISEQPFDEISKVTEQLLSLNQGVSVMARIFGVIVKDEAFNYRQRLEDELTQAPVSVWMNEKLETFTSLEDLDSATGFLIECFAGSTMLDRPMASQLLPIQLKRAQELGNGKISVLLFFDGQVKRIEFALSKSNKSSGAAATEGSEPDSVVVPIRPPLPFGIPTLPAAPRPSGAHSNEPRIPALPNKAEHRKNTLALDRANVTENEQREVKDQQIDLDTFIFGLTFAASAIVIGYSFFFKGNPDYVVTTPDLIFNSIAGVLLSIAGPFYFSSLGLANLVLGASGRFLIRKGHSYQGCFAILAAGIAAGIGYSTSFNWGFFLGTVVGFFLIEYVAIFFVMAVVASFLHQEKLNAEGAEKRKLQEAIKAEIESRKRR